MLRQVQDSLLALVFPRACSVCGSEVDSHDYGSACGACWKETRLISDNRSACPKCGLKLHARSAGSTSLCHRCDEHFYDIARSAAFYEKAVKSAVLDLKKTPKLARLAGEILYARFVNSEFYPFDLIVPVPLSRKRMLERGFNQAEILGRHLGDRTGIELRTDVLIRSAHTQIRRDGMDRKARAMSVQRAFEVTNREMVRRGRVVLIDDVFTSGATASACSEVLKKAGAAEVGVLTLARTPFV